MYLRFSVVRDHAIIVMEMDSVFYVTRPYEYNIGT